MERRAHLCPAMGSEPFAGDSLQLSLASNLGLFRTFGEPKLPLLKQPVWR